MASRVIRRRIVGAGLLDSLSGACPSCRLTTIFSQSSQRYASKATHNMNRNSALRNPIMEDYLRHRPKKSSTPEKPETITVARGKSSENSIFDDEEYVVNSEDNQVEKESETTSPLPDVDQDVLSNVMDPDPVARLRWERKKIIQQIRKRGQLTKAEIIKQTERESMVGSHAFKTSPKKLVMLARQIAGKPIDEAILQMRYSKKRAAQDILKHLEYAKNMAIVNRGLGLGKADGRQGEPIEIELKDGKKRLVTDRTTIYVDQAWVNKGEYTASPEYRGRGRVFRLTHRRARITVLLKEEATRVRLSEERKEKRDNRKLWLHLPDRPISLQRQYPLW